jgi:hypothetical protein
MHGVARDLKFGHFFRFTVGMRIFGPAPGTAGLAGRLGELGGFG